MIEKIDASSSIQTECLRSEVVLSEHRRVSRGVPTGGDVCRPMRYETCPENLNSNVVRMNVLAIVGTSGNTRKIGLRGSIVDSWRNETV
jgi:hypothetical protein